MATKGAWWKAAVVGLVAGVLVFGMFSLVNERDLGDVSLASFEVRPELIGIWASIEPDGMSIMLFEDLTCRTNFGNWPPISHCTYGFIVRNTLVLFYEDKGLKYYSYYITGGANRRMVFTQLGDTNKVAEMWRMPTF